MKRSVWIVVVGLLAILIGGNGILQGLASLASTIHEVSEQSTMVREGKIGKGVASSEKSRPPVTEQPKDERSNQYDPPLSDQAFELLWRLLADHHQWDVVRTAFYLLLSVAYLIAGIALVFKSYGPRIFLGVVAASLFWSLMQILWYSQGEMEMLLIAAPVFGPSVVIDLLLAAIVWAVARGPLKEPTKHEDRTSSTDRGLSLASVMNVWIPKITGFSAALFGLIVPFWLLGVPGVENTYAQGWRMGLDVIMYYPFAWVTVFGISWLLKRALPLDRQAALNIGVSLCFLVFFSMALLRLGQAFQLIAT